MLKALRLFAVPLILVALAAPAWANDINIIFDPNPPTVGSFDLIQQVGVAYSVSWGSCTQNGVPAALAGDDGCLLFINQTGQSITDLSLSFTANAALVGQSIICTNLDSFLTTNTCAAAGTLSDGEMVSVEFDEGGGSPVPNELAFFIAENGVPFGDLPPLDVQVPDYDPSTLVLLVASMAMLGMCGIRRFA